MYTHRTPFLTKADDFAVILLSLSALTVSVMPCTLLNGGFAVYYGGIAFIVLVSSVVRILNGISRH
ncbi:hypothetical protein DBR33_00870 [Stenotrophomonas sp. HMWF022]|uniref:hypothetical protein n=1 Tax=Stenotrophomonas sp. HMWF023 TaxID=2056859 RepID=UPI000D440BF2|nr:hypothetical protein [Stenotrophomonas sp. HMWF023]PTT58311.1 hypothetical protein DBR33_00870 [Stenotrophomonas sp. HMWF022]